MLGKPTISFVERFYQAMFRVSTKQSSLWIFCLISFCESSFFPFPPDFLMIPMIINQPKTAWKLASLGTITSVLGGMLGYGIGYFLYNQVGHLILTTYNLTSTFDRIQHGFSEYGFWIIALKGIMPFIPYKLITITCGLVQFPFFPFVVASFIGRGSRFFILSGLLYWFGPEAKKLLERYPRFFFIASLAVLFGIYIVFKYFHF